MKKLINRSQENSSFDLLAALITFRPHPPQIAHINLSNKAVNNVKLN